MSKNNFQHYAKQAELQRLKLQEAALVSLLQRCSTFKYRLQVEEMHLQSMLQDSLVDRGQDNQSHDQMDTNNTTHGQSQAQSTNHPVNHTTHPYTSQSQSVHLNVVDEHASMSSHSNT